MKLAVLSDTHLRGGLERLPGKLLDAMRRSDAIVHAGDVVSLMALDALRSIKDTYAVLGNNDHELAGVLPDELRLEFAGVRVAVVHNAGPAEHRAFRLHERFPDAQVVVFGHSHVPVNEHGIETQLLFNPGSPTQRRTQPRRSYGTLALEHGRIAGHSIVPLGS